MFLAFFPFSEAFFLIALLGTVAHIALGVLGNIQAKHELPTPEPTRFVCNTEFVQNIETESAQKCFWFSSHDTFKGLDFSEPQVFSLPSLPVKTDRIISVHNVLWTDVWQNKALPKRAPPQIIS